jgi:hypothetical protein
MNKPDATVVARGALYWVFQNGNTLNTFEGRDDAFLYANHYRKDPYVRVKGNTGWIPNSKVEAWGFERIAA